MTGRAQGWRDAPPPSAAGGLDHARSPVCWALQALGRGPSATAARSQRRPVVRPASFALLVGSKIDEATRGLSGTSLHAAIRCLTLIVARHQCPHRASVASWTRLPKQNPACRFPALGSPDDFCEDLRFIPLDAMYELTAARTPVDRSDTPSRSAVVDRGVAGRASSVAGLRGGSS